MAEPIPPGDRRRRPHAEHPRPRTEERSRLSAYEIYEVVRRDGEIELERPVVSLWWSGLAAGFAIVASLIGEGLLHHHLGDIPGRDAIASFGYTLGFVIVLKGRLHLFTENTITPILPMLAEPSRETLRRTALLWVVIFLGNMLGSAITVAGMVHGGLVVDAQLQAITEVSRVILEHGWPATFSLGIPAGFLIAAVVWLLPTSRGYELLVIVALTYVIALGGFSHVVAGSAEAFLLFAVNEADVGKVLQYLSAAFAGNVVGGTGLFAMLAYAQVRDKL